MKIHATANRMNYFYLLLGLGLMWAVWKASRPQAYFVVRINQGRIETTAGKVTAAFLDQIRVVTEQNNIQEGEIRGLLNARRIQLKFSTEFSNEAAQQLRNWWGLHGWGR